MLEQDGKGLSSSTAQEPGRDARLFSVVPFRAWKDRQLVRNDLQVLIAACSFLKTGATTTQVPQHWIAQQMGVHPTLIVRHIKRLEAFGYIVQLKKPSKDGGASGLFGIIYNTDKPPTMKEARQDAPPDIPECANHNQKLMDQAVTYNQKLMDQRVTHTALGIEWKKMYVGSYINEQDDLLFRELATIGCTADHLRQVAQPGRDRIGFYMQQLRALLRNQHSA